MSDVPVYVWTVQAFVRRFTEREAERLYEMGRCPHQRGRAAIGKSR